MRLRSADIWKALCDLLKKFVWMIISGIVSYALMHLKVTKGIRPKPL